MTASSEPRVPVYDFILRQGSTWVLDIQVMNPDSPSVPLVITSYTIGCQFRETPESTTVLATPTAAILDATLGKIRLSLTAAQTAALTRNFVYDVEITSPGGVVTAVLEGKGTLKKEVTR